MVTKDEVRSYYEGKLVDKGYYDHQVKVYTNFIMDNLENSTLKEDEKGLYYPFLEFMGLERDYVTLEDAIKEIGKIFESDIKFLTELKEL